MRKGTAAFLCFLLLVAGFAFGQKVPVQDTKHNLSVTGPGTIKAASETEICVFCHTPHGSSTVAQLWNRTPSTASSYVLYSSDYLTSLTYPVPAQPKTRSKLCLSCHDGTIALGSVYNLPGSGGYSTAGGNRIPMNLSGSPITDGKMPTTAAGFLDTDLTNDHPVGYMYDTAKDAELDTSREWPWNTAVRLDPDTSLGTVECQSCHDPHNNQYSKFLRMSNDNAALCTHCHNKTNYAASAHRLSTQTFTPPGGTATTVGEYSCRNCHKPHSSGGTPYVLRAVEQNTCFESGCHGTLNPGVNTTQTGNLIQPEFNKVWKHPTVSVDGAHKNIAGGEAVSQLGSTNRHAECQDCHNPHQAQPSVATATRGPLKISVALKGVWGVSVSWPGLKQDMTNNAVAFPALTAINYTRTANPEYEYQVCLKCHSNYVTLPAGARNIAQEINPNNSSYHGIAECNAPCTTNTFVNATTANEPWATNKRVWCSDCHGSEAGSGVSPKGPHGSNNNGTAPGTSNGDKMLVATIASTSSGTPLCLVCHKSGSYATGNTGSNNSRHGTASMTGEGCFACHMWSNPATSSNGGVNDGKIYPHGMNAKWAYFPGTFGTLQAGSGQPVNAFNGGWYTNMNYTTKTCWSISANADKRGNLTWQAPPGSPCGTHANGDPY